MIRMVQSNSAAHAKAYFSDALSKSDYYVNDQELEGRFYGRLAERLGVSGVATKEAFFALCENRNPVTGNKLTLRTREERRVGYDINFHCPKSVSILHALSKDDHILEAFQKSVLETMEQIEADAQTRIRKNAAYGDRRTGELIWAEFTHQTARPVEGHLPDPHLHSHCFVFNATYDAVEKQYKACELGDVKRDMPYYQAWFHKRLADHLSVAGYTIEPTRNSFEVIGVPKELIRYFSKRTDEIGRIAKDKGITNAKDLDELGARTRSKKLKSISMTELRAAWKEAIRKLTEDLQIPNEEIRYRKDDHAPGKIVAHDCVDFAIRHEFTRASVMGFRRLKATALRSAIGLRSITTEAIDFAFAGRDDLMVLQEGGRKLMTRKEVLEEEKRMVGLAKSGIGRMAPLYDVEPVIDLEGEQKAAVAHVLKTKNRVSIVRGAAGTGKSTLMKEAKKRIEAKDKTITVLAPSVQASRVELRKAGFEEAETVARFLMDTTMQQKIKDQVLWVDEAGLLGTQDMARLLEIGTKQNARIILGGDTRQHSAVVRGDALRILNTVGGIRAAEVNKIYRQQDPEYRNAVNELSKGNIATAFEALDGIGAIKMMNADKPYEGLTKDYIAALKKRRSVLVISPTHKEGEKLTDELRKALRKEKRIGRREVEVPRYQNLNMTDAQKEDCRNYSKGQYVQFNQNIKGAKRGSLWEISMAKGERIQLKDAKGQVRSLPRNLAAKFDVLERSTIRLSKGDKVMITRPAFDENKKRLNNGSILTITGISKKGAINLRNNQSRTNYKLEQEFGHLSHAHVLTSYASQGKTVDEVFVAQSAASFPATDAKQFYVSVSRGKHAVHIYTDDKEALLEQASHSGDRDSALLVLEQNRARHKDHMERLRIAELRQKPKEKGKGKDIITGQPHSPGKDDYGY